MRKWMLCLGVAVMACFAVQALFAAEEGERMQGAMGTIKSIDVEGGKIVVAVTRMAGAETAKDVTFLVTKDTKIMIARQEKTLKDLAVGNRVEMGFRKAAEEGGTPTAVVIAVIPERKAE